MKLTKIIAAEENLKLAIRLYLQNGHLGPVITLANAAREVVAALCEKGKLKSLHDTAAKNLGKSVPDLVRPIIKVANFLKHADRDPGGEIDIDESTVAISIYLAAVDFSVLVGQAPPEADIYMAWSLAIQVQSISSQSRSNQRWLKYILRQCPGLRSAPWPQRKELGLRLLNRYVAGRIGGIIPALVRRRAGQTVT